MPFLLGSQLSKGGRKVVRLWLGYQSLTKVMKIFLLLNKTREMFQDLSRALILQLKPLLGMECVSDN